MDTAEEDICRVCRSEGTQDRPLYHPCVCTGSIKFIHQECLLQWLKHSRKEYCELCQHRFAFTPIYSPDMPSRLPVQDIFTGLLTSVGTAVRYWFHYTLVAFSWLGLVPLTACRIYKCLFAGSVSSLLTLPLDLLSTQNLLADCLQGCFVVACTLGAFISLVWLREQIVHGGAPQWLEQNPPPLVPHGPAPADQYAELQQRLNWASIHPSTRALEWTPVFPAQSWTSWSTPERRAQPLQHRSQCDASGRPEPICRAKTEPLNNGSMSWQQSDKVPLFCTRGFSFSWCTWLWSIILSRLHVLLPSAAAADVS